MDIKVLGSGCKKCQQTEELVKKVISDLSIDGNVEKVTDIKEIAKYGVMLTPAVVVDGKPAIVGKVPSEKELIQLLNK
ncbi:thioredoxin family protein [Anaerovorax odorimutans]|uniref:thioredoxin family protein n=1 Tax=Anaerovorax odorimutans TaxID=109327 RepID=UPI00041E5516|nr:thioredoxin family protein [Anaerovorax odorimutans]